MIRCQRIPLLDVDVYFVTTLEEAKTFIREKATTEDEEKAVDGSRGCCYTVTDSLGHNHRMMCVFDGDRNTAIHEAVHMAWMTLRHCGIKAGASNEEPMAFLTAWLAEQMIKEVAA